MKKITLLFIAFCLAIGAFSQDYTYTGEKFIQTFEGDQKDETGIFTWTSTDGKPMSLVDGTLKIENAFQNYNSAKVNFLDTHLDLSEVPYVSVEVKASVDTLIQLNLMDGDQNHTSGQHTMRVNSEWQTFTFNYFKPIGIYGDTDITDIASVVFDRAGYADTDGTLWIKWIAVGDTSYKGAPRYTLEATAQDGGSVTKDPDQTHYDEGTEVTVTASPIQGYRFDGWTGDTTASDTTITLTMNADKSITANFTFNSSVNANVLPELVDVYPNPADDVLFISGLEGSASVTISDLTGKTVIEIQGDNITEIDVSGLQSGMYVLTCTNDKGILNETFVKQ
jgi:uncharacterized repeat protein (TIGR02543 family)